MTKSKANIIEEIMELKREKNLLSNKLYTKKRLQQKTVELLNWIKADIKEEIVFLIEDLEEE